MNLNVSLLPEYLFCARKVFITKILGIKEPPSKHLALGKIRHEFFQEALGSEQAVIESIGSGNQDSLPLLMKDFHLKVLQKLMVKYRYDLAEFDIAMADAFRELWQVLSFFTQTRSEEISSFIEIRHVFGKELWQQLEPKRKAEFSLSSTALSLKGRIDQIEEMQGLAIPLEIKSGRSKRGDAWNEHKIQLCAYAMMLEEHLGKPVPEGYVLYLAGKEKVKVAAHAFLKQEVIDLIKAVQALLTAKALPDFVENRNKCKQCGVRQQCYDQAFMSQKMAELRTDG